MEATRSRHGRVHMFITHCPNVTPQLHNFDLFRTIRTSSFCTVAWQLARFQLTRRIARSLGDSWALFSYAKHREIIPVSTPEEAQMQVGWVKIGDFRQITGYIPKTVQNRRAVSIKVVCALSNGDIADDLEGHLPNA